MTKYEQDMLMTIFQSEWTEDRIVFIFFSLNNEKPNKICTKQVNLIQYTKNNAIKMNNYIIQV